jgi:hypothetical protein
VWLTELGRFVNYKKGCIRFAAASDKVYQLLAHGRWFSPGTSASSTTKTGRHDIAGLFAHLYVRVGITHMWKPLAWPYHINERGGFGAYN